MLSSRVHFYLKSKIAAQNKNAPYAFCQKADLYFLLEQPVVLGNKHESHFLPRKQFSFVFPYLFILTATALVSRDFVFKGVLK